VKNHISIRSLLCVMIVLAMSVSCAQATPSGYKADMVVIQGDDTLTNIIYISGQKYRIETEEEGQPIHVIVDQEAGLTRVINVGEQAFLEMPCDDMRSLINDPFQSLKYTAANQEVTVKSVGTEVVSGLECEKATLVMYDEDIMTQWVSSKLGFPVKIVTHAQEDRILELRNIEETTIDDGIFEIPEGFSIIEAPQPQAVVQPEETAPSFPDWVAAATTSAELVTLPLERVMAAGDMIRIKVVAGKEIFVLGTNVQSENSTFLAVPFLNGKPIDDPSMVFSEYGESRMHELMMEGVAWPATLTETPEQADEVVVRVEVGQVKMAMEYTEKP